MKARCSGGEDVMLVEFSGEAVDRAEEAGPVVVHLSKDGRPAALETLDASEFLAELSKAAKGSFIARP